MDTSTIDWQKELTFIEGGETFPFVEDENANITGYGHQNPDEFAAAINHYDEVCGSSIEPDDQWRGAHVTHQWATPEFNDAGDWLLRRTWPDVPGAIPVTTLWGQR